MPSMTADIKCAPGRLSAQGLNQHTVNPKIAACTKLLDADFHILVPFRRLGDVGSE